MTQRGVRLLLVVLFAVVLGLAGAGPASAHNSLVSTFPAGQATVARVPAAVVLTFNQPALALGSEVVITGPAGPVQQGRPALVNNTVRQAIRPGAHAGKYVVTWRITSADGHPVNGSFAFSATAAGARGQVAPAPDPPPSPPPGRGGGWLAGVVALLVVATVGSVVLARRRRGESN